MNPYTRFRLITNSLAVAVVALGVGLTTFASGPAEQLAGGLFGSVASEPLRNPGTVAVMIGLVVLVWLALSHFVFPRLFGMAWIRRAILGRHYFEGTWVKGVRLTGDRKALAVMDIQPLEDGFTVTGRFINETGEVTSNYRSEFQSVQWPVVNMKPLHNRPDENNGARDGVFEVMFEANNDRPERFDGCFLQGAHAGALVEGVRLNDAEARRLRNPAERANVLGDYWAMFFSADTNLARRSGPRVGTPSRPTKPGGPGPSLGG